MIDILRDKRVLVIGINGQVGRALVRELVNRCELITAARCGADIDLDLSDREQTISVISSSRPDIVINAAAYTQVDMAEDEPDIAHMINAVAPGIISTLCKKYGSTLIHYSTDYVFSGKGNKPLMEDAPVSPVNVYGETKLEGERAIQSSGCDHLIFRTCWVYDAEGKNFLNSMLEAARKIPTLQVVGDQFGTPTSAEFIARVTVQVISQSLTRGAIHTLKRNRIYNLTALGNTTWHGFAMAIINRAAKYERLAVKNIDVVTSRQFPRKAKRPHWSVLNTEKLCRDFDVTLVSWEKLVNECLDGKYVSDCKSSRH